MFCLNKGVASLLVCEASASFYGTGISMCFLTGNVWFDIWSPNSHSSFINTSLVKSLISEPHQFAFCEISAGAEKHRFVKEVFHSGAQTSPLHWIQIHRQLTFPQVLPNWPAHCGDTFSVGSHFVRVPRITSQHSKCAPKPTLFEDPCANVCCRFND